MKDHVFVKDQLIEASPEGPGQEPATYNAILVGDDDDVDVEALKRMLKIKEEMIETIRDQMNAEIKAEQEKVKAEQEENNRLKACFPF